METEVILALVILETVILILITAVLHQKSRQISQLAEELSGLRQQDKLTDFLPMLVHELRAPISVIKGGSDLLLHEVQNLDQTQIHELLIQIETSSKGLLSMVNDILDVSKMDAGKFEISREFININDLLEESTAGFKPLAKSKNISLETQLAGKIPNISADPDRIKQVMNNFLSNAIKFTDEDGIIKVISEKYNGYVKISICDTGTGVTDDDKKRLFHKFQQAHNRKGVSQEGTGLGLVIAKGIVESHRGRVWIEDNKPKGARFIFTLPAR